MTEQSAIRCAIPLSRRRIDIVFLVFFLVNLFVITYMVDFEQLVIADPSNFQYPVWPPAFMIDAVHRWGQNVDALILARPVWWKVTIWIDSLFFGPFYAVAIYAYVKGKEWIRIPSIIYGSVLLTVVSVILGEELYGPTRPARLDLVLLTNAPWVLFPMLIIFRMWRAPHPFTEPCTSPAYSSPTEK
jgi:EXPERA (EXPanded EBP superfamily)